MSINDHDLIPGDLCIKREGLPRLRSLIRRKDEIRCNLNAWISILYP